MTHYSLNDILPLSNSYLEIFPVRMMSNMSLPDYDWLMPQESFYHSSGSDCQNVSYNASCRVTAPGGTDSCTMPVTVRVSLLNLLFMKLLDKKVKSQVQDLQNFYYTNSAKMESDRFSSLSSAYGNQYMQSSVNMYYDQLHHALISRVESSIDLIEKHILNADKEKQPSTVEKAPPVRPTTTNVAKSVSTNNLAIRIMTNWYDRNSEHPYPSYETAEVMAKAGGITVEQVKKWFANRRLRLGHTKHITEIAKRRKRSRTVSRDDILLTGSLSAE